MQQSELLSAIEAQRAFFASGATRDWRKRKHVLNELRDAIVAAIPAIDEAVHADLHKSPFEVYATETGMVLTEIKHQLRCVHRYRKPRPVAPSLFTLAGASRLVYEPYGVTLIVSPWNYPFHLSVLPMVGAVASGNTVVMKLSPQSPHTNGVIRSIVEKVFPPEWVLVVEGHREVNAFLFEQRWNHIFLTGSPELGKVAMASAARYLTPVTLELGGKSPCIVDEDADIALAAKRIVYGKLINSGQTCIAPDYLMVHSKVKDSLLASLQASIRRFFGDDLLHAPQYPHIVSDKAMQRLVPLLKDGDCVMGGRYDMGERFIEPTVLEHVGADSPLLTREIFGPIFPLMTFDHIDEVIAYVNQREKPLAFYYFSKSRRKAAYLISRTSSGGACVNDTLMHITNPHMPFGGVENSGLGNYHGRFSYATFTHQRSVYIGRRLDYWFKYPPFTEGWTRFIRRFMR